MKTEIDPWWGDSYLSDVRRSHGELAVSSPWSGGKVVGFVLLLLLVIPALVCVALFLRVLDAPPSLGRMTQAAALLIAVGAMMILIVCCFRGRVIMQISRRGLSVRRRIGFLTLGRQHVPLEEIRQINYVETRGWEGIVGWAVQVQTLGRPISFNCDVSDGEVLRLVREMRGELAQVRLGA
jgi:hypothetical protein